MKRRRFALDVRPGAVALLAGLYFLLPLRWCARLALAVAVHELGHVAALVLCGTEIYGLRMEACGLALPDNWHDRFPCDVHAPMVGTWQRWGKVFLLRRKRVVGADRSESLHPTVPEAAQGLRAILTNFTALF